MILFGSHISKTQIDKLSCIWFSNDNRHQKESD